MVIDVEQGDGAVRVEISGDQKIKKIHIDPEYERPDKNSPVESILERQIKLEGCKFVDKVVVYKKEEGRHRPSAREPAGRHLHGCN